jgi:hypothetical protein
MARGDLQIVIVDSTVARDRVAVRALVTDLRDATASLNLAAVLRRHPAPSTGAFAEAEAARGVEGAAELLEVS